MSSAAPRPVARCTVVSLVLLATSRTSCSGISSPKRLSSLSNWSASSSLGTTMRALWIGGPPCSPRAIAATTSSCSSVLPLPAASCAKARRLAASPLPLAAPSPPPARPGAPPAAPLNARRMLARASRCAGLASNDSVVSHHSRSRASAWAGKASRVAGGAVATSRGVAVRRAGGRSGRCKEGASSRAGSMPRLDSRARGAARYRAVLATAKTETRQMQRSKPTPPRSLLLTSTVGATGYLDLRARTVVCRVRARY